MERFFKDGKSNQSFAPPRLGRFWGTTNLLFKECQDPVPGAEAATG